MKPFFALLKKDFLLSKWCLLAVVLLNLIAAPCYAHFFAPEIGKSLPSPFLFFSFLSVYMMLAALSTPESKFPKAEASLCTAYPRSRVVLGQYAYLFCTYLLVLLIHVLWRSILPQAGMLTGEELCFSLLVNTVWVCLYLPIRHRFSPQIASISTLMLYFAVMQLLPYLPVERAMNTLTGLPLAALTGILLAVLAVVFSLSSFLSIRFYQKKDL